METTLRLAGVEDTETLVRFRLHLLEDGLDGDLLDAGQRAPLAEALRAYFERHLRAGDLAGVIVEADGKPVCSGVIIFYEVPPSLPHPDGRTASLYSMYTLTGWRRRGLARRTLSRLLDEAEKRGLRSVNLTSTSDGEHLYRKAGFRYIDSKYMRLLLADRSKGERF